MEEKIFVTHKSPDSKYEGLITYGNRDIVLSKNALISITLGEKFPVWKTIVNGIVSQFVMKQMKKSPKLLYAEMKGNVKEGYGLTMTVWEPKSMKQFRDSGAHKFAMRFFSWVFYSGKSHAYFLTFKHNGSIPTSDEAIELAREYGRFFDGGKLIRHSRPPIFNE
ncbi:hypothetical protein ACFFF5_06540 [Lederbergia wuyishanensis]|uniref:LAGLIDADG homing endonuclease n=1 Tax=Lederbergia wuyishanensis TaxID=1347903 RepID=A0ABU0D2R9_9BACI|nr:hypothetical protein [Lederbergia wuyishanensis]MCJ8007148.1 hypothetical protein [Lederbergia wuyishanensis]MDQ0342707.1 hypothetical protein [Lederbergia wuyishanensis]